MRPRAASIRDIRSVWGAPLELPLGARVTTIVGPNRAGASTILFALAASLDASVRFDPARDLPRPHGGQPQVTLLNDAPTTIRWDPHRGVREVLAGPDVAGHVVLAEINHTPRDLLRRLPVALGEGPERRRLADAITAVARRVVPEVATVEIDPDGRVVVRDELDSPLPVPQTRVVTALGVARHLADEGRPPAMVLIAAPEAFLHPAAQEAVAGLLAEIADRARTPVVVSTMSPFVVPTDAASTVAAIARDAGGRTGIVGSAPGDGPRSHLLGGLLRDGGLAKVFDRVGRVPLHTRAVVIVEGGTDEAYLRLATRLLGRDEVLDGVHVVPAGGAMGTALAAIVLRAELDVPVVALLDHDGAGRRARDTLVSRFGFERGREVLTYADVLEGGPTGVDAETLFDQELMRRFVAERGPSTSAGEHTESGVTSVRLTPSGKSAFVGWLEHNARPQHLEGWDRLVTLLDERLPGRPPDDPGAPRAEGRGRA